MLRVIKFRYVCMCARDTPDDSRENEVGATGMVFVAVVENRYSNKAKRRATPVLLLLT